MKFAIVVFPGSNCDQDCYHIAKDLLELRGRVRLAPRDGPERRRRRDPAGRLRLRRLPAGRRARALLARDGQRREVREGRRSGPRHLQRIPGSARGGPPPRRDARQPRAALRLPRRVPQGRERRDAVHAALRAGVRREDADRAHGGQLHGAARGPRRARAGDKRVVFRYCDAKGQVTDAANPNGAARRDRGHLQRRQATSSV